MKDNKETEQATMEDNKETEQATGAAAAPAAAKEEMVTIILPKSKEEKDDVFVSVNERSWLIQRGVKVKVPRCVLEVLEHKAEMEATIVAFDEAHASKV